MELSISQLLNAHSALIALNNTRGLEGIIAFRLGAICEDALKEIKRYHDTRMKMVEEAAKKDDNGNPVIIEDEKGYKIYDVEDEDNQRIEKELEKIRNEQVTIKIKKVSLKDIAVAGLSPYEMNSIKFLLKDVKDDM